jgi:hypothetical protein
MNSNETNFESLRPLTVRFVMMKIRPVRIVSDTSVSSRQLRSNDLKAVKSDIANMIVPSNATSPLTLSVESVGMLATWPKIVRIDRGEPIGATMVLVSILAVVLREGMQWIVRWK